MAGHYVYRGVVPSGEIVDKSRIDTMTIWGGPDLHMVQYLLEGGAVMNNVATICSRRIRLGEANPGAPDELEEIFARTHPGVRDNLRYVSRERNWVLHDRDPVANWTSGRVTLLGDAAHPTLQYLAQGAQMASRGCGGVKGSPETPLLPAQRDYDLLEYLGRIGDLVDLETALEDASKHGTLPFSRKVSTG